jgi:glycosyltransferase involved in cell wall biosynthesis
MRLGFVVDAGSPIASNWIRWFCQMGHEVHVVSTFPVTTLPFRPASLTVVPVAMSAMSSATRLSSSSSPRRVARRLVQALRDRVGLERLSLLRDQVGPFDALRRRGVIRKWYRTHQPELVHAMRIPFEGILAAEGLRPERVPLVVSIWGNDLTLHAPLSRPLAFFSRRTLRRATALHTDCRRDYSTALAWGWSNEQPWLLAPGNGGITTASFQRAPEQNAILKKWSLDTGPIVLNPRGMRGYVRNETFFGSIPLVLTSVPNAQFVGVGMAGHQQAEIWRRNTLRPERVHLLPTLPSDELRALFCASTVAVSPSEHDGTPNTLLEAMAAGAFPIVGDIPSVREWIISGHNGLIVDPRSKKELAEAVVRALTEERLRQQAALANLARVKQDAEWQAVMPRVEAFYEQLSQTSKP